MLGSLLSYGIRPIIIFIVITLFIIINLRKVVPTNEVHIVQRKKDSIPFGRETGNGNVYLNWPSWVPSWGITVTRMPLSIFDIQLKDYKAYDNGKVPFKVDITAFLVIKDPIKAAEKIDTFEELLQQLEETLKGAVRKILAGTDIITIMEGRSEMSQVFYEEVLEQVKAWGVELNSIEFMDIRDDDGSQVVLNIMKKKKATIEAEARIKVAQEEKNAKVEEDNEKRIAEVNAVNNSKEIKLKQIEMEQTTENQNIEKERLLALQREEAKQKVLESQRETKDRELNVKLLEEEKSAEIEKIKQIIKEKEIAEKMIIAAEAEKQKVVLNSEAQKESIDLSTAAEKNKVESIGLAKAKEIDYMGTAQAKNKLEMAKALNTFKDVGLAFLAKELEIGLLEKVDLEKAKALAKADIKVISTGSNGGEGVNDFMELFSAKGGTNLGAMFHSFKDTLGETKFNEVINTVKTKLAQAPTKTPPAPTKE